tara:strand:- start:3631 stop:3768 length:138 start_codon:yes stop_codon:yes gene_type:complete
MGKLIKYYLFGTVNYVAGKLWDGIWTAVGFIIIMKTMGVFIILTS